jgi:hypothetical protein
LELARSFCDHALSMRTTRRWLSRGGIRWCGNSAALLGAGAALLGAGIVFPCDLQPALAMLPPRGCLMVSGGRRRGFRLLVAIRHRPPLRIELSVSLNDRISGCRRSARMAAECGSTIPPVRARPGCGPRRLSGSGRIAGRAPTPTRPRPVCAIALGLAGAGDYLGALISSGAPAGTGYLSTTNSIVSMWKWPMVPTVSTTPRSPNWSTMAL